MHISFDYAGLFNSLTVSHMKHFCYKRFPQLYETFLLQTLPSTPDQSWSLFTLGVVQFFLLLFSTLPQQDGHFGPSHFTLDAATLQPSHVLYAHVLHAHTSAVYYFLSFVLATQPTAVSYFFPSYFRLYWPHLLVVFSSAGSLQRFVMFSWLLLFFSPL